MIFVINTILYQNEVVLCCLLYRQKLLREENVARKISQLSQLFHNFHDFFFIIFYNSHLFLPATYILGVLIDVPPHVNFLIFSTPPSPSPSPLTPYCNPTCLLFFRICSTPKKIFSFTLTDIYARY